MHLILLHDHKNRVRISGNDLRITYNADWCRIQDHIVKTSGQFLQHMFKSLRIKQFFRLRDCFFLQNTRELTLVLTIFNQNILKCTLFCQIIIELFLIFHVNIKKLTDGRSSHITVHQNYFLTTLHQIQYKVRCCRRFSVILFQTAHHQHFIMIFVHLSAKLCDDLVHSFRILRRSPWICDQNRLLFLFFLYKR